MGLVESIKADIANIEKKGVHIVSDSSSLLIEQELNKLFYVKPNYKAEMEMLKHQYGQKSEDRYGLHLSAILESDDKFCYREQVLSLFYKQCQGENVPIGLKRIYEEGNFIGEKWQRLFIRGGLGTKEDMDVSRFVEEYDLSYTPDIAGKVAGQRQIVETKSMNTFQFKKANSHPKGRKQLRMYMYFERNKYGFVLVEDKNDQSFKVFPERWGETFGKEDVKPYVIRLENVQKYKKLFKNTKTMIDGICRTHGCKRALDCNMRDACFNVGMGRVKLNV